MTVQRTTEVTCREFRAWMQNEDDLLDDDPDMNRHFITCQECKDWSDLETAILEREHLPALTALYGRKFQLQ
jgi:hypothetical protein